MERRPLSIDEVLTTTRAVRKRLDFERPVPRSLVEECLRVAVQAPTGSNSQTWHFVLVDDPAKKRVIADAYRRSFEPYVRSRGRTYAEGDVRAERMDRVRASSVYLADRMHEVPLMLIPCIEGRPPENSSVLVQAGIWGSLLPAVWSFMLAARARGLGTAWTTLHLRYEEEVAETLGIPYARIMQGGMVPVGFYTGDGFRPAKRLPLDQVMHWNSWG